uniref:Uncharacterized protein n=1 Tax=Oryza barthii TaxID=65489 RepID=A0A0D3G784_9ORYZ
MNPFPPIRKDTDDDNFDTLWDVYPALWLTGAWVGGAQVSVTLEPRYVGAGKPWRAVTMEFLATVQIASAWDPLGDAGLPCPIFTAPRRPAFPPSTPAPTSLARSEEEEVGVGVMDRQRQQSSRGNASATATRGGGGGGGGGGVGKAAGKKPIKVVYISNPMRPATPTPRGGRGAGSSSGGNGDVRRRRRRGGGYDDDDDVFRSQLLDTSYSVFSPPTLLYDDHPHSKV